MKKIPIQSKTSLNFDRKCLKDLGLKMPRTSTKYMQAIGIISSHYETSPYFTHIMAARRGLNYIYNSINDIGFIWDSKQKTWVKIQIINLRLQKETR